MNDWNSGDNQEFHSRNLLTSDVIPNSLLYAGSCVEQEKIPLLTLTSFSGQWTMLVLQLT
jgi:hypothetical protein